MITFYSDVEQRSWLMACPESTVLAALDVDIWGYVNTPLKETSILYRKMCYFCFLTTWNLTLTLQPENADAQEEENQKHYDPVAAATEAWGDDGTQPIRYDPIAAATEGWGDDGTHPICYDPVTASQEGWEDDGSQPADYSTVEEAQEGWDDNLDQPVEEDPAAVETPVDDAPSNVVEEDTTSTAPELAEKEGQVTEGIEMERCIWTKTMDASTINKENWACTN